MLGGFLCFWKRGAPSPRPPGTGVSQCLSPGLRLVLEGASGDPGRPTVPTATAGAEGRGGERAHLGGRPARPPRGPPSLAQPRALPQLF